MLATLKSAPPTSSCSTLGDREYGKAFYVCPFSPLFSSPLVSFCLFGILSPEFYPEIPLCLTSSLRARPFLLLNFSPIASLPFLRPLVKSGVVAPI